MRVKPAIPREQANGDVDEAVAYYLNEASEAVALGFIDALEKAYRHLGRQPATGSPRYAHELNLPGLRAWSLTRYPYLVFYVERPVAGSLIPHKSGVVKRRRRVGAGGAVNGTRAARVGPRCAGGRGSIRTTDRRTAARPA